MRKYLITYYIEKNDDCVDVEKVIEANTITEALEKFKELRKIYKRIIQIKEI